ncbi:histamine N-methyltransferase A-like [Amphiura filiformis]|uniref:histamine N-methyltransferase A-like n=1 Tax=Amphiura filiformis TaxID=82378 RepID=UPI003B20E80E
MSKSDKSAMPRPLSEDLAHYTKAFKYIASVGDYFEVAQKWTEETFYGHVVEKLVTNLGDGTDGKLLRVLGIGSGSGELELGFLNKLLTKFPKIQNCVVEVTQYYTGYGKLWRTFPTLGCETASQDGSQDNSSPSHRIDAGYVRDALRQLQIPNHEDGFAGNYKITECFSDEESDEGNLALDFLTHTIRFRDAPSDLFQQVLACIKESCVQRGDERYFQSKNVCFVITKPTESATQ